MHRCSRPGARGRRSARGLLTQVACRNYISCCPVAWKSIPLLPPRVAVGVLHDEVSHLSCSCTCADGKAPGGLRHPGARACWGCQLMFPRPLSPSGRYHRRRHAHMRTHAHNTHMRTHTCHLDGKVTEPDLIFDGDVFLIILNDGQLSEESSATFPSITRAGTLMLILLPLGVKKKEHFNHLR